MKKLFSRSLSNTVNISKKSFKPTLIVVGIVVIFISLWQFQQNNIDSLDKKIRAYETKIIGASSVDEGLKLEKDILGFEKDKTAIQNGAYTTLVQALGGLILSITAWIGYQNFKIGEKNLKVSEDKQVTERFSKSIEHLGNEKIDIRLGGIYALEQIAIDSQKYHWPIVEILSAYIREKCSNNSPKEQSEKVNADIQAALTVLIRRKIEQDLQGNMIDLRNVKLPRVEISQGNLSGAALWRADLSKAILWGANLSGANLQSTSLSGAYLIDANLSEANLSEANLEGANLAKANLERAKMAMADLYSANLIGANLEGAILAKANLIGANLSEANLSGADLNQANLSEADLNRANLIGANLSSANLSGADLNSADLSGANLSGANLSDALNYSFHQVKLACYWDRAIYVTGNRLANDKKVEELKQDKSSNHPSDPDCSRWELKL